MYLSVWSFSLLSSENVHLTDEDTLALEPRTVIRHDKRQIVAETAGERDRLIETETEGPGETDRGKKEEERNRD